MQKRVINIIDKEMFHKTLTVLHLGSSENPLARIQVRVSKTISNSFPHHFALESCQPGGYSDMERFFLSLFFSHTHSFTHFRSSTKTPFQSFLPELNIFPEMLPFWYV